MEVVSLKMDKKLLKDIDSVVKSFRYSTRTEFIRDAIRSHLNEIEKEIALKRLAQMRGSLKPKNNLSDEEVRDLAFKKILKRFNMSE